MTRIDNEDVAYQVARECGVSSSYHRFSELCEYITVHVRSGFRVAWTRIIDEQEIDEGAMACMLMSHLANTSYGEFKRQLFEKWPSCSCQVRSNISTAAWRKDVLLLEDWLELYWLDCNSTYDREHILGALASGVYSIPLQPHVDSLVEGVGRHDIDWMNEILEIKIENIIKRYEKLRGTDPCQS